MHCRITVFFGSTQPTGAAHCFVPDFTNCADSICCWSADAKSKLVVRYGVYFYSIANFSLENFSCSVQLTKGSIGRWYLRWFIYFWYENKSLPFSGFRENSILQVVKSSQNTSIRFCAAIFSILFGIPSSPGVLLTSTLLTAFSISLAVTGGIDAGLIAAEIVLWLCLPRALGMLECSHFLPQPSECISPVVFINFISELAFFIFLRASR